ncbi:MAG: hypothetical protein AABX47_06200 [Nanoarchaeota archaeon]
MNATKTTLCMLLSAAIGSAATATAIWEMGKREDGRWRPARPEICHLFDKIEYHKVNSPLVHLPGIYTEIPEEPQEITADDKRIYAEQEISDLAAKCGNETNYRFSYIEGVSIAFTTLDAQRRYMQAMSNIVTDSPLIVEKKQKVADSIKQAGAYKTLPDGIPVIDYPGATRLVNIAAEQYAQIKMSQTGE